MKHLLVFARADESRFRMLLRWYPRAWRERNGAVLLGTMLDDAEREGQTVPSVAERLSAVGYGLGTRLNGPLAVGAALAALAAAAAGGAGMIWAIHPLAAAGAAWVLPFLTVAVAPGLIALGAAALARQRGLISELRALFVALLSPLVLAVAALALVSWEMAFAAADLGVAPTGLAAAWVWLFGTAWVLGATAIAVFVDALLYRSRPRRVMRTTTVVVAAVLFAPVIGVSLISPYASVIGAAGLALLTLIPARHSSTRALTREAEPRVRAAGDVPTRTRSTARLLACVTAVAGAAGVGYALTGARWSGATDATAVMGQGVSIALLSALPLLAAIGVLVAARGRTRLAHTWGPLILVALSLTAVVAAYRNAPAWDGMAIGFAVASALGGVAIAWWLGPRLRGPARSRIAVAVLIGVGYAAVLGVLVAPMLAFALPLAAVAFAIWASRRPGGVVGVPVASG